MKGLNPPQSPTRLKLSTGLIRADHARVIIAVVVLVPVLALLPFLFALPESDASPGERLAMLYDELMADGETRQLLWMLAVALPLVLVYMIGQRLAWMRMDSNGIECHIPRWLGLGFARQTVGHWRLGWGEIQGLRLDAPTAGKRVKKVQLIGAYRLVLTTATGEYRLSPFPWFNPQRDHRLTLGELRRGQKLDVANIVRRAPLFDVFHPDDAADDTAATPDPGETAFDLTSHKGMAVQLVLLAGAGGYAVIDGFFLGQWRPLETVPILPFVLMAVLAFAVIPRLGQGAPRTERLAVSALTIAALVAAVYPGLLRFNATTAEPQLLQYQAAAPGLFTSRTGAFPDIDLTGTDVAEYWEEYPPGSEHEFRLLHGEAGFTQLDLGHFYAKTRDFYRQQE